jgi:hypothetical protein
MYYSRFPRLVYPTRAYHHRRPLTAEAAGVAGSEDTHVVGEAIGRQAFLLGEVLRHAEDGRVLRQPLECLDRREAATPQTSHEGFAFWELDDNEPLAEHSCGSADVKSQKKWTPLRHVNGEDGVGARSMDWGNWPVVGQEVLETLVADEMYRQYIDEGQC